VSTVEADEVRAPQRAHALELAATLLEEDDILGPAGPERLHEPPALGELLSERRRHGRVSGRDKNRIEGRVLRQSLAPVAADDDHVVAASERRARGVGEIREALDAEDLPCELGQERGLPAVAGTDSSTCSSPSSASASTIRATSDGWVVT
jgi:hypothetical protein